MMLTQGSSWLLSLLMELQYPPHRGLLYFLSFTTRPLRLGLVLHVI